MASARNSRGLQTIFSFFLGLMLTAFIGVGVYTFHPPPQDEIYKQIEALHRQEQAIRNTSPKGELDEKELARIQEITDERNALSDAARDARDGWFRSTSIIVIIFATVVMAISLVRADQLQVISNGFLLGGVLTMVYGVGWSIATGISMARFVVISFSLAITLGLGYIRFVRGRASRTAPAGPAGTTFEGLGDIELRVKALEERMDRAADALGTKSDD